MNALVDIIRKYARPVIAAAAISIGFSGCAQKTYQKEHTPTRSQDNSQRPLSLEEEARIYNAANAKLQAVYALRDGPDADSPESFKKQEDLTTEVLNMIEGVKPSHYDKWMWQNSIEQALQLRGNAWCALGNYEQAIADYNKCLLITDYSAGSILNNRGLARREQGDANGALIDFLLAAGLSEDSVAFYNRAQTLVRLGRLEEAMDDCDKALSRAPGDSDNYMLKARIYRLQNPEWPISALADAERAITLDPNNISAYVEYALAAIAISKKAGFVAVQISSKLDTAIKLKPDMHELYGLRAYWNFF